jgi:hypothetical protein
MGNVSLLFKISKLHNVWVGCRYLEISDDRTSEGTTYEIDFTQNRPMLGWAFTW